jgi:hypothetical protein
MVENKRTRNRRYFARLLEELADSGMTITEFARKRRIPLRNLQRWKTAAQRGTWVPGDYLADATESPGAAASTSVPCAKSDEPEAANEVSDSQEFVLVPASAGSSEAEAPSEMLPLRLIEPPCAPLTYELTFGGRQLRLPHDFEVQRVARLVRALEGGA